MKVLVLGGVTRDGLAVLEGDPELEVEVRENLDEQQLEGIIPGYEALIVHGDVKIGPGLIERAAKLRVIGSTRARVDNIDLRAATKQGILVVNAPGGSVYSDAEYTMAMLLALARNITRANARLKSGSWDKTGLTGSELRGKTLGIIGLGRTGTAVARKALALDMQVVAYDPHMAENNAPGGVQLLTLEQLLSRADYITIHAPRTAETSRMLDDAAFSAMKEGVMIINCSRGGIIDEEALARALAAGKVAGAALDAFENEPVTSSPLFAFENVVVSPRIGSCTREAEFGAVSAVAREIAAALRGEPVSSAVNMPVLPRDQFKVLKPFIGLVEKMGRFLAQVTTGRIKSIQVRYCGEVFKDTAPLTTAMVKELLDPVLQENVNYVNAPVLARERGIAIEHSITGREEGYTNLVRLTVHHDGGESSVAGFIYKEEPRIVMIDGYRVDAVARGHMILVPHVDRPGMIGRVGTVLGDHGVNISGMLNSRKVAGGTSLMVIMVDMPAPPGVLDEIASTDGVLDVEMISL